MVAEVGKGSQILYQKMEGMMVVSSRDFCYSNNLIKLKNGSTIIVNFPVEHESAPEGKSVRGDQRTLFVFKPLSDTETELTNILNIDLKGKIPGFITSKVSEKQHDNFKQLRTLMEKRGSN